MQHSMAGAFWPSINYLCTPRGQLSTSAHFGIQMSDGHIVQMVDTDDTAWHAMSCNSAWVGIEHDDEGDHADPWRTDALYTSSSRLNQWLAQTYEYTISEATIRPHRSCVATACPSGLDVERIIIETQGGDMANYIEQGEFEAYVGDVRASFEAVKQALHTHKHGLATFNLVLPRKARKVPTAKKKPTRAEVRSGHGRAKK